MPHNLTPLIAKHFRELYFGGNWTASDLKKQLTDVTWQEATQKIQSFNTIAILTYHIHYYVSAALKVLEGGKLDAKDAYSFSHPPIESAEDWAEMQDKIWIEAGPLSFGADYVDEAIG